LHRARTAAVAPRADVLSRPSTGVGHFRQTTLFPSSQNRETGITQGLAGKGADANTDRKCKLRVITVERCSWIENCIQNGASPRVIEEGGKKFRNEDAILRTTSALEARLQVSNTMTRAV
jgi:hypothetical protein